MPWTRPKGCTPAFGLPMPRADVLGDVHAVARDGEADTRPACESDIYLVTVRYSNGTGLPTIPDNDPARSGPRNQLPSSSG